MKKYIYLIIFQILMIYFPNYSQKEANNWFFSLNTGITFNTSSGNPVALSIKNSHFNLPEGSSSISDSDGNLLFFTNGFNVWNKSLRIMKNGEGLAGNVSSTQSSIIIPFSDKEYLYYIFTTDDYGSNNGLNYSIVNMTLDDNQGEVTKKNVFLFSPVSEKLAACKHSDNKKYWVVTHAWNSNAFYSYLITEDGISSPVITPSGSVHGGNEQSAVGYMKISPNGKYLALAVFYEGFIEIFKFDNNTGTVSSPIRIDFGSRSNVYGIEFSPNSKYIYVSVNQPTPAKLFQFDLSIYDSLKILNSKTVIDSTYNHIGALQLGPDRRIYISVFNKNHLDIINYPNRRGKKCSLIKNSVKLGINEFGIAKCFLGLPNFISDYFIDNCSPESFDYPIFKKEDNLTFLKDSKLIGDAIRLSPNKVNQRGAVWHNLKVDVTKSFTCDFSMRFSQGDNKMFDDGSLPGADGLAFVIQNNDILSIGETGGGLGYHGIPNSIAIEFDLYWNKKDDIMPIDDPNGNHIAVQCNGTKPNTADHSTTAMLGIAKNILTIKADSTLYYVRIKYEPDTLMVFMDTINYFVEPVLKIGNFRPEKLLNLEDGKRAYIGFTSSTGASVQNNDIEEWYFCNQTAEIINDIAEEEKDTSKNVSQLSISPNPAGEYIEITFRSPRLKPWVAGVDAIKIYNLLGECVLSSPCPLLEKEGNIRIDVSGLPAGVYFLRIGDWVGRFLKI